MGDLSGNGPNHCNLDAGLSLVWRMHTTGETVSTAGLRVRRDHHSRNRLIKRAGVGREELTPGRGTIVVRISDTQEF